MNFLEQLNRQLQPTVQIGVRPPELVAEELVAMCVEDRIAIDADLKTEFVDFFEDYFSDPDGDLVFEDSAANWSRFKAMPTS